MAYSIQQRYVTIACANCGMTFGMTTEYRQQRLTDGKTFYCPAGHGNYYGDCEHDRTRRERDALKQRQAQLSDELADAKRDAELTKRTAAAYKGQATKLRKRAKHGVCPCCTRTFKDLASHMKTKHPDFGPDEPLRVIEGGKAA